MVDSKENKKFDLGVKGLEQMCHRPLHHNLSQWDVWVYLPSDSFHIFCGLSLCLSNYLPIISFWKLVCYMLIFHYIIVGWMIKHSLWHPENYRFNGFFFRYWILSTLYTNGNCLLSSYVKCFWILFTVLALYKFLVIIIIYWAKLRDKNVIYIIQIYFS